jgi:hypothetical protein
MLTKWFGKTDAVLEGVLVTHCDVLGGWLVDPDEVGVCCAEVRLSDEVAPGVPGSVKTGVVDVLRCKLCCNKKATFSTLHSNGSCLNAKLSNLQHSTESLFCSSKNCLHHTNVYQRTLSTLKICIINQPTLTK